jgi:hypothetical protein
MYFAKKILLLSGVAVGLSGCGMFGNFFDTQGSVTKKLNSAAKRGEGKYRQPLALPPNYELRPPARTAKSSPVSKPAATATKGDGKKPGALSTSPSTAKKATPDDTDKRIVLNPKASRVKVSTPKKIPTKVVRRSTKSPSSLIPEGKPDTRGKDVVTPGSPSKGESELLKRTDSGK